MSDQPLLLNQLYSQVPGFEFRGWDDEDIINWCLEFALANVDALNEILEVHE
jgi:hypothetical protein